MSRRWVPMLGAGAALLWGSATLAQAAPTITVNGGWSPAVGPADLQAGPGSDLNPSLESAANQVVIDVLATTGDADAWRIDVRRSDTNWPFDFDLLVQRTADGMGTGSIDGGDTYLSVVEIDQELCTGAGDRMSIATQMRIDGFSLQVPPDIYATTVTYTLVDL